MRRLLILSVISLMLLASSGCLTTRMWRQPQPDTAALREQMQRREQEHASASANSNEEPTRPAPAPEPPPAPKRSTAGIVVRCIATPVTFTVDAAVTVLLTVGTITGYRGECGPIDYVTDRKPLWAWED